MFAWSFILITSILAAVVALDEKMTLANAQEHFFSRRFDDAEQTLRALAAADPGNLPVRYLLVRTLVESNQLEGALREAESAVERSPSEGLSHVALGDVRFRLADFDAALTAYREAVRLDPREPRAHLGLGRALFSDFHSKSAREHFTAAFNLDPTDPDVALAMSSVMPRSAAQLALEEQFAAGATYRDPEELDGTKAWISLFRLKEARRAFVPQKRLERLTVQLQPVRTYGTVPTAYLLPISVNGGEPRKLLVDSGAHGILISSRLAQLDSVKPLVPYRLGGLGDEGRAAASLGWADSVRIGDLLLHDCPLIITERPIGPMWEGIIGTDVFRDFLISLDFRNNVLRLEKPAESAAEEFSWDRSAEARPGFTPLRQAEGKLLVLTSVNGRATAQFILDTGAARSLIDRKVGQAVSKLTSSRRRIRGISGQVQEVQRSEELVLEFAGLQHRESLVALDFGRMSYALGVEIGGLIGSNVLQGVCLTIDYRNGMAKFQRPVLSEPDP